MDELKELGHLHRLLETAQRAAAEHDRRILEAMMRQLMNVAVSRLAVVNHEQNLIENGIKRKGYSPSFITSLWIVHEECKTLGNFDSASFADLNESLDRIRSTVEQTIQQLS